MANPIEASNSPMEGIENQGQQKTEIDVRDSMHPVNRLAVKVRIFRSSVIQS
jgi:hypothetical protein